MSEQAWYAALGGQDGIARLVDRFYDVMDTRPEARGIRDMHPADLAESRSKLWMFLVGRFGGPDLYVRSRGHPRLRARHLPFAIGVDAAAQWMDCMDTALAECVADDAVRAELRVFFATVAAHMRNIST